ncbi:uncharacterized protein BX664DRAFT_355666 [Halteromyces radiatus]|uniref:uncharacterized protein n=1 Tax=Halteromyces radiatus TaxID=101107 RepID=UPI00221F1A6B|nr:uncharacterized protein BX664DRAFT_355666 [Halteromyces radiatus]KAI8096282.1 hypothetical protein BX664DRAFT_355666 [Halteromyces radiatus]
MSCKKDFLLGPSCPELLCGLCNDILDEPMQVHCSEDHMFCRSCLATYEKASCPSCLEPLDKASFQLSKFVKRQISRLRIRCIYHSLGCTWEGLLEDNHPQLCEYQTVRCPNAHLGCSDFIGIANVDQHKEQCLYELISCPNSSPQCQPFLRKDAPIHASNCSSYQCPYSHEGCTFIGTLPEVNKHCELYCGKLHERIQQLELQCSQMKQQLTSNIVDGLTNNNNNNNMNKTALTTSVQPDSSMDEMTLIHQMFNNSFMNNTTTTATTTTTPITQCPPTTNNNVDMMDLSSLSGIPLNTLSSNPQANTNSISSTAETSSSSSSSATAAASSLASSSLPSTTPLTTITSGTAPKRSTNGKIIRYSKNKQLAHGALRMARQRTPSSSNLTTEAILQALHIANKSMDEDINMTSSVSSPPPTNNKDTYQSPSLTTGNQPTNPQYSFKNLDDVTKFLEELPPVVEASPFLSSQHSRKSITKNKNDRSGKSKSNGDNTTKRQGKMTNNVTSPEATSTLTTSTRPMFILASTLLSKRTQEN